MSEARAKLYINTGVVTGKSDIYNILRPLLKQTVSYTYYRGARVLSSGTGWVERIEPQNIFRVDRIGIA